MYRLKKEEDLSLMLGATLAQVCFGENDVILNFDKLIDVTMLSEYEIGYAGVTARFNNARAGSTKLLALIGKSLVNVQATEEGGLYMRFSSQDFIEVLDDSDEFESFWLRLGDRKIVV